MPKTCPGGKSFRLLGQNKLENQSPQPTIGLLATVSSARVTTVTLLFIPAASVKLLLVGTFASISLLLGLSQKKEKKDQICI